MLNVDADPGDRDPGDGETAPATTVAPVDHLSWRPASPPPAYAGRSPAGRDALDDALELLTQKRNDEATRAGIWNKLDTKTRKLVVWVGGMEPARADGALASFDAFERGCINVRLTNIIRALERAQVAMNGGAMPSTKPNFESSAGQGIAAPGALH